MHASQLANEVAACIPSPQHFLSANRSTALFDFKAEALRRLSELVAKAEVNEAVVDEAIDILFDTYIVPVDWMPGEKIEAMLEESLRRYAKKSWRLARMGS